ncbi:hypothetical protein [Vibrio alginolyticus]|uniref:hypothetical protein n=1 Tax=Vibrio alginolyticus TaxID=663 RepID=UPI001C0093BC|nr:hypothetical protein [Vibrio alginolyticus]
MVAKQSGGGCGGGGGPPPPRRGVGGAGFVGVPLGVWVSPPPNPRPCGGGAPPPHHHQHHPAVLIEIISRTFFPNPCGSLTQSYNWTSRVQ